MLDEIGIAIKPVYIIRLRPRKCRPVTSFFMVNSLYNERHMLKTEFITRLQQPHFGVINANVMSFDFDNPEETIFDGIKCNKYTSSCGDELYVHKVNVNSYETQFLGGSL